MNRPTLPEKLVALMRRRPGTVCSYGELLRLWDLYEDNTANRQLVHVAVARVGPFLKRGEHIAGVRGVGYAFVQEAP